MSVVFHTAFTGYTKVPQYTSISQVLGRVYLQAIAKFDLMLQWSTSYHIDTMYLHQTPEWPLVSAHVLSRYYAPRAYRRCASFPRNYP